MAKEKEVEVSGNKKGLKSAIRRDIEPYDIDLNTEEACGEDNSDDFFTQKANTIKYIFFKDGKKILNELYV